MDNSTRSSISKSKVSVDRVFTSEYQKEDSLTAQVRQTITRKSWYASKQPNDSLTHNLFEAEDFGYSEQEFESEENRVAFILVPVGQTQESVQAMIDKRYARNEAVKAALTAENVTVISELKPATLSALVSQYGPLDDSTDLSDPCIYRILSNHPILSTQQIHAIKNGLRTKAQIAEKQVVRYSKGDPLEGSVITDQNGKVQYKRNVFSKFHVEDEDRRTADLADVYTTEAISAEVGDAVLSNVGDAISNAADTSGQSA